MKVRDAMAADVRSVGPGQSIAQAARMMSEAGTGFLPVTEADRPVGVVTDRDIVVRFLAGGGGDATAVPVSEVMTSKVTVVGPDDDLAVAAEAMRDGGVRRLVVIDAGVVVGVLSHGSLVQATDGEGAGLQATLGVTAGA
jgi:CBS domain-containing protein